MKLSGMGRSWKPKDSNVAWTVMNTQNRLINNHLYDSKKARKKVSFALSGHSRSHNDNYEDSRNLGISISMQRQFNSKPTSRYFPDILNRSETHSSFMRPEEIPIPMPPRHPNVNFISRNSGRFNIGFNEDPHLPRLKIETFEKIHQLRSRIIAGEAVAPAEIHAVRQNVGYEELEQRWNSTVPRANRHPKRKRIFCEHGIVKVPTPHSSRPRYNTFGSPADLRISLSNTDSPEYQDRRRYFFDFTGFLDKDVKLYLEDNRNLIILGNRPPRNMKRGLSMEESIRLPKDLPVDNLRIVRDVFGTLIVEEAWKFK